MVQIWSRNPQIYWGTKPSELHRAEPLNRKTASGDSTGDAPAARDTLSIYCRRWSSNPSGKCSYERLTRGTVCGTMRFMCGADAGWLAINYQSLYTPASERDRKDIWSLTVNPKPHTPTPKPLAAKPPQVTALAMHPQHEKLFLYIPLHQRRSSYIYLSIKSFGERAAEREI